VWKENYEKRTLKFELLLFVFSLFFLHIRTFFLRHCQKFFLLNHFFQIFVHFFVFLEKSKVFLFTKMSDLIIFFNETSEVKIDTMIEKLKCCFSTKKYRMQITILDRIVQTRTILDEKTKRFWEYVIDDAENWRFHHSIILNFIAIYFVISKIVNAVKKKRSVYQKTIHIIERLWEKKKYKYAINQSIEILRNMRKVVIKSWSIHDVMKTMIKAIEYRLKNSKREMRKKIISINDDWIKVTTKIFMSSRLLIETKIIVIMSSSFAVRLKKKKNRKTIFVVLFSSIKLTLKEEKKNRKTFFVVLFSSMMMSSIEKKKNQRTISVDFFFDRVLSSSSLSSSSINFESQFVTQSFRSLSSSIFRNIAIMFDALMKNVVSFSKIRLKEKYLTEQHHEILSSISFTSKSSSDAFRSRKRAREMISITSKKRVKSSKDSCECAMSTRWREVLTQVNRIRSIRSVEHLLKEFYYLERQICERHINELERLYDLLSMKNLNEMKNIFWRLLKYSRTMKIFKIENVDLYESFENDD
jgi:hypothetical protein